MGKELHFNANISLLRGEKSIPNSVFCHLKQNQNFMRGIPPANHKSGPMLIHFLPSKMEVNL